MKPRSANAFAREGDQPVFTRRHKGLPNCSARDDPRLLPGRSTGFPCAFGRFAPDARERAEAPFLVYSDGCAQCRLNEVLIPAPGDPLFDFLADLCDVSWLRFPLIYDHGWQIDFTALTAGGNGRARA
jgi:hypothetical protein